MGATLTQPSAALRTRAETSLLSGGMLLLCLGHMTTDLFSSAIPTLQPILVDTYSLSLAQAGWLGGMFMFSSSVLQLPFGIFSDRVSSRHFNNQVGASSLSSACPSCTRTSNWSSASEPT